MFLGIDVGTSSVKAILIDERDRLVAQAAAPLSVQRPFPMWSEQRPDDWVRATIEAVSALPPKPRRQAQAIGLSGQMHGVVALDALAKPLRPAILWNDGRSEAECRELEAAEPNSRAITGNLAMPGFSAPKLLWLRKHEPEMFSRIATVLLPKDYLRLVLTGEAISDMSDAAGTLWLDVAKRDWSDAMLAATGLTRAHMPILVEGSAPAGRVNAATANALGVGRIIVAGGGGDNAASGAGMGAIAPGDAFLSLGTSGVLFVATDRFRPNTPKAVHAFCHCLPERWHQMAVSLSAASALDWVTGITGFPNVAEACAAAMAAPPAGAPLFLPYLSGERTPHNDPRARGVFWGLTADTSREALVYSVLEGVAFAFKDGKEALLEGGGEIGTISVTGGGARLAGWGKLIASALGRTLVFRELGDAGAALGAARLARLALTGEPAETVCRALPIIRAVEPDEATSREVPKRFALYQNLYRDLKPSFRR